MADCFATEPAPKSAEDADRFAGQMVRACRQARGISQEALADKIGVSFQQVQKYERGDNRISISRLVKIAQALSANPGDFIPAVDEAAGANPVAQGMAAGAGPLMRRFLELSPARRAALVAVADALAGER